MTPNHCGGSHNGDAGGADKCNNPPEAPSLTEKCPGNAFFAKDAETGIKKEIKLTVEFPLRSEDENPNGLAL